MNIEGKNINNNLEGSIFRKGFYLWVMFQHNKERGEKTSGVHFRFFSIYEIRIL